MNSCPNNNGNTQEIIPNTVTPSESAGRTPLSRRIVLSRTLIAAAGTVASVALVMAAVRPVRAALLLAGQTRGGVATSGTLSVSAGTITTDNVGVAETEAGNIVADAVRMATGADIAFVPASAFRANVSLARPVTGDQAANLIEPADEAVVILALQGDKVRKALERAVALRPQASGQFLQVSNVRFAYNEAKRVGERVGTVTANGAPLDSARTYRVAMTRALASGQQGYFRIWETRDAQDTGKTLAQSLRDLSAARGGALSAPPEGRISPAR